MSNIKINKKLNLVIPIETDEGLTIYVHSTPIMRETFEMYYKVISSVFTEIYSGGIGITSAPRVASLLLKDKAKELGIWEGPVGVKNGLVEEIKRLTNVIAPTENGWSVIPIETAISKNLINEDDAAEVDNAICYFIVASSMHKKSELRPVLDLVSKLWGGQVELLNAMDYAASLVTSTEIESIGEKVKLSSIPS